MTDHKISTHEMATLVELAQGGDAEAFGKLYDVLVAPIYRYIYYRVGRTDAEDLTEQVFLKSWEKLGQYHTKDGNPFSAWVFRIAHNLVVDHYRLKSKNETLELPEDFVSESHADNPANLAEQKFNQSELKAAIRRLPESYQQVIVLKFINEFENTEIAKIIKKSEGAVRILQFRALARLKTILETRLKQRPGSTDFGYLTEMTA